MSLISTVLFDLGNVLAYIDFDAFWRSLGYYQQKEIAPFKDRYKSWTFQYETGNISTDEYLKGLHSVFNDYFTIAQLELAFANIILDPVEGMADIVKRVSRTCKTALVSNTNEIHYTLSLAKFDVLKIFPKQYLSFQLRVMKPAEEFYSAIIKDLQVEPSEILFVDDLQTNLDGAIAAGMQVVKFDNKAQLEEVLMSLGVI